MSLMTLDCPHCPVTNGQFQSVVATLRPRTSHVWTTVYVCNACTGAVAAKIEGVTPGKAPSPHEFPLDPRESGLYVVGPIYPEAKASVAPAHTPDAIARAYLQALSNIRMGNWDAAGAMARKSVEVATKSLLGLSDVDAARSRTDLNGRINKLEVDRRITPDLKDWAHAIRLDGNRAVHGEFTEDEAKEIVSFAELFLIYVFQLPGMLAERKAKQAAPPA